MSTKDCGHEYEEYKRIRRKRIFTGLLVSFLIILLVILLIWAILKPNKPKFMIQDATLYNFNLTSPAQLTSTFQVTVQARNPNDKIGIYYDRLITYATYHDQQISLPTSIPPTYQDTKGMNIWSPFLQGKSVPIAPYIGGQIDQELQRGSVYLVIKMDGRLRWKVGSFISGPYRIHVNCPAYIPLGNPNNGVWVGRNAIKYQLVMGCTVSI